MNAKQEFLEHVKGKTVLCAEVKLRTDYDDNFNMLYNESILLVGYSNRKYNTFLKSLDFEYDDGFGGQNVFGTIWYTDGTWSDRGEYDGSEWWEYLACPLVPDKLRGDK
jgi:hypothetical protein